MTTDATAAIDRRRPVARLLRALLPAAVVVACAFALRRFAIEPAAIAHACDPSPWSGACAARSALILTFVDQEIGWIALAAGVVATLLRSRRVASLALACGGAGLVLYSYEPAAVGALLGLLVLARAHAQAPSTAISAA
jgi:hypothetical protein